MTVKTAILDSSRIWDIQIKNDLELVKQQLEQLVTAQYIARASIEKFIEIEALFYSAIETDKLPEKSQKLLQFSSLCLQLLDVVDNSGSKELVEISNKIEYLRNLADIYAGFLSGINYIIVADFETDLIEKFKNYSLGFEIIATMLEGNCYFLSSDVCKTIKCAADAALQVELEATQNLTANIKGLAELARNMRRSVTYILWMLDRLAEQNKVETFKTLKHSLTPFLKHQGQTAEEQLEKNQAAMKLLKGWIEEEVSEEELKEREKYFDSFKEIVDNERPIGYKLYSK